MKLLFWNLKKNEISSYMATCLAEHDIDIAIVSEFKNFNFDAVCASGQYHFFKGNGGCDKIRFLVRSEIGTEARREHSRFSIVEVTIENQKYLLAGLHLQDRMSNEAHVRIQVAQQLMSYIDNLRDSTKITDVIVIGDFNAGPYDVELLQRNSFNAVLFKEIIEESESCEFGGRRYKRLYNPTVHFLSEEGQMYGSFYYNSGAKVGSIWHCLDQALVSKSLINRIEAYQYLRKIGADSLIAKKCPKKGISDHLPLLVEITELEA